MYWSYAIRQEALDNIGRFRREGTWIDYDSSGKPFLSSDSEKSTSVNLTESVLKFCLAHKNPVAEIYLVDGADGEDTEYLFDSQGYKKLSEKAEISY